MEGLPTPPGVAALRAIPPDLRVLPAGTALARIWLSDAPHPTGPTRLRRFGPTSSRFDHHLPDADGRPVDQARGILYAALAEGRPEAVAACAAEVFQATRRIDLRDGAPRLAVLAMARAVRLLDLTGYWPVRAGGSSAIASGPCAVSRAWSRAFHEAYPSIDGLLYMSSMAGGTPAVALTERAEDALPAAPRLDLSLADPVLRAALGRAAALTGYAIVP